MAYQFLKNRGALNEAEIAPAGRPAPAMVSSDHAPEIAGHKVTPELIDLVPESVARESCVIPIAFDGERITFAAVDTTDIALADKLRFILAKDVRLVPAPRAAILEAINQAYAQAAETVDSFLHEAPGSDRALAKDAADEIRTSLGSVPQMMPSMLPRNWRAPQPKPLAKSRAMRIGPSVDASSEGAGMFFYVVEEGQRVMRRRPNGTMDILVGPQRVWTGRNVFYPMVHYAAHPDRFLIVRYKDGRQEHLPGPAEVWQDPRVHLSITSEEALQLSAKEAVVVYSKAADTGVVSRRLVYGPTLFVPQPGEWLHTFSWHASRGGSTGVAKVANALVFQKLWLMPDQMYHDVHDVRTADDAVLTIHLMIFFELTDIERMLDTTHDPIGDFVNAATSDVVAFTGKYDFESFKRNTHRLNDLETYGQLTGRAGQCGYRINKVVFRGYGAAAALQQMHDQAIQARTRLQLDRATEQQAQDLENYKLECQLARSSKRRTEQANEVTHDLALAQQREEAEIRRREARQASIREMRRLEEEWRLEARRRQDAEQCEHLQALRGLDVNLTAFLTQARADQVIELRGTPGHHVHIQPAAGNHPDGEKQQD
jgi:hypothetical protein